MRVPKELLPSVSHVPPPAPKNRSVRPPWADRMNAFGEAPGIGDGVGIAAFATWLLSGSLPAPPLTSFAVRPPHSAAHAAVAASGTDRPGAQAGPSPVPPQPDAAAAAPGLVRPDVLTVTPPPRTAAPPRSAVAPRAIPTQATSQPPSPGTSPTPTPTPTPSPTPTPTPTPAAALIPSNRGVTP